MKHPVTKILLLVLFAGLPFSIFAQQQLPEFSFLSLEGEKFSSENLKNNLPVITLYFDPYCDHCEQQAKWIRAAENHFQNVQLLWVSMEQPEAVTEFKNKYFKGSTLKHLHFVLDTEYQFDKYFGYSEIPSVYIYNQKWLRVAEFHQETEAEKLLDSLRK